jgi:hypothetical protein
METKFNIEEVIKNCAILDYENLMAILNPRSVEFWTWGVVGLTKVQNKALKFQTSGLKHAGYVYITVNGMDLFDIYLTDLDGNLVKEITDLYDDMVFSTLDEEIESGVKIRR